MTHIGYLEALVVGNIAITVVMAYFLVALIFYVNRSSQIRLLNYTIDPRKISRNRRKINSSIELASREKRFALIWPIFLLQRLKDREEKKKIEEEK